MPHEKQLMKSKPNPNCFLNPLPVYGSRNWCGSSVFQSLRCGKRIHAVRKESCKHRKAIICGLGLSGFMQPSYSNSRGPLPNPDTICACGSEKSYGKCCRRFHTAQSSPPLAEDLLRSRYSAYAYRLPSYIMKTTHSSLAELDRRKWKREIMGFCRDYKFVGGVDIIEQQLTGPYTTRILFR